MENVAYKIGLISLASMILSLAPVAFCQIDKSTEAELKSHFKKTVDCMKRKDVPCVMESMTSDFTFVSDGKKLTRKDYEANLKKNVSALNMVSSDIRFYIVQRSDKAVNAHYTVYESFRQVGDGQKIIRMDISSRLKSRFVRVGDLWKLAYVETVGQPTVLVDGKPIGQKLIRK